MLIDQFLPEYDFCETHSITIGADRDRVYKVLNEVDFCDSWIVRWLFRLRGLPSEKVTLKSLQKISFETLGETEDKELLMGLVGRFWRLTGDLKRIDAKNFKRFSESGHAKAVWNFSLGGQHGKTDLITETRIKCLDTDCKRRFGRYWTVIQPFSGLIRMEMLRTIKRVTETGN